MADNELKIKISADYKNLGRNELKAEIKSLQTELDKLGRRNKENAKDWDTVQSKMVVAQKELKGLNREYRGLSAEVKRSKFQMLEFYENLTVATAGAVVVLKKIADVVIDSVKAFAEDEEAAMKLYYALDQNNGAFGRLQKFVSDFQNMTGFADDQINSALSFLAIQGRSEEQMIKIIQTAGGMSKVVPGMEDIDTAVKMLDATFEGNVGRMGRLNEELKKLTPEQLRNGDAVEFLYNKYGKLAEQIGETTAGKMRILEAKIGDLKEELGRGLVSSMDSASKSTQDLVLQLDALKGMIFELGASVGNMPGFVSFLDFLAKAKSGTIEMKDVFKALADTFFLNQPIMAYGFNKITDAIFGTENAINRLDQISTGFFGNFNRMWDLLEGKLRFISEGGYVGKGGEQEANKANRDLGKKVTGSRGGSKPPKEKVKELKESSEGLAEAIRELAREMQFENTVLQGGILSDETLTKLRTFNESWLTLSERIEQNERMKSMNEMLSESIYGVADAMGVFMESLASGDIDGFKNFMKQIVNAFITSVQAMLFAAGSAAAAKGITSFGLSLITDLPQIAAAWVGLELAKGLIQGLATGGQATAGTPYIVGERGRELFIPNQTGYVMNNRQLEMALAGAGGGTNVYINADIDGVKFLKSAFPKYINYAKYKRI
jgi:hypothetical protein